MRVGWICRGRWAALAAFAGGLASDAAEAPETRYARLDGVGGLYRARAGRTGTDAISFGVVDAQGATPTGTLAIAVVANR
jgi:hypothetical protein